MLPTRTDPKWRELLVAERAFQPRSFALKMLLTRLRRDVERDTSEPRVKGAVEELHSFFERNEEIAREDLRAIFN